MHPFCPSDINAGRAIGGSIAALTIGVGTYIDFKHNDKTAGEAFTKNATAGGTGLLTTAATSAFIKGVAVYAGGMGIR